jgi:hypothetical protein
MSDSGGYRYQPPKTYRTKAEADVLMVEARAIVAEVKRRLPADKFDVAEETLFVAVLTPEEIAYFALSLPGIDFALAPVPVYLGYDFAATVEQIVGSAWTWRHKIEEEVATGTRPEPAQAHLRQPERREEASDGDA